MEQKEIKDKMVEGIFKIEQGHIVSQVGDRATGVVCALPSYGSTKYKAECTANAEAICHSVNNTYGNKIDPTKVPEMYMMLVKLKTSMEKYGYADTANEIQQLLTAAKL